MKITIEHYNKKYSVETDYDDISFEEVIELFESLTKSIYGNTLFDVDFKD